MATKKAEGNDIIVTTAFELIGVALLSLLAGANDAMGTIVIVVMVGFVIGWLFIHSGTLGGWVKGL